MDILNSHKKCSTSTTRSIFNIPIFKKSFKHFSFTTIAIKLLNRVIFCHLDSSLSLFKKFLNETNLIELYQSSEHFWT